MGKLNSKCKTVNTTPFFLQNISDFIQPNAKQSKEQQQVKIVDNIIDEKQKESLIIYFFLARKKFLNLVQNAFCCFSSLHTSLTSQQWCSQQPLHSFTLLRVAPIVNTALISNSISKLWIQDKYSFQNQLTSKQSLFNNFFPKQLYICCFHFQIFSEGYKNYGMCLDL